MESLARKFGHWVALAENPSVDFFQARARGSSLFIGSRIESDPDFQLPDITVTQSITSSSNDLKRFESRFLSWLTTHKTNKISGLECFQADYSEGTTQAFDSFYTRHKRKRFRCFVGEYFYHLKVWQACEFNWAWTNGDDLQPGDALVLSVPFCDTVIQHSKLNDILDQCTEKNIPVLLDLCYYTISSGIDVDVSYPCVDTVAFSLSKAWPVSNARIGMRYTRSEIFDGQKLHSTIGYNNNIGARIGNAVLDQYGPDWIVDKRIQRYSVICDILGLTTTNSVNFGIGDQSWHKHSRRELLRNYQLDFDPELFVNRICLNKIYQHWGLFQRFILHELNIEI